MTDFDAMEQELSGMTMKQLKEIARTEGICLGYAGSKKHDTIRAIIAWRRLNWRD